MKSGSNILTFRDGEGGRPLVSKDVEANAAICVDVGVIDAGGEVDLWGLEGVIGGESDAQEEHAGGVRAVRLSKMLAAVDFECRARRASRWYSLPQKRAQKEVRKTYRTHDRSLPVELR